MVAKVSKSEKMYADSKTLARGEDGKMAVTKKEKESSEEQAGTEGVEAGSDGMPAHARHASERRDMHNRHETEHAMIDSGKGGDKKEVHGRHEKEMKDMHSRHEKESSVKDKITKV